MITPQELESFMAREFTSQEEAQAQVIIDIVSAVIEDESGVSFTPIVDDVITIQADGHGIVEFNRKPVMEVSMITDVNGVELDGWEFDGLSCVYGLFPQQVVNVTYSHGYDDIPRAVKGVALGMASRVMYNPSGLRQETVGAISVTYPGIGGEAGTVNMTNIERSIIGKYAATEKSMRLSVLNRRVSGLPILTIDNDID